MEKLECILQKNELAIKALNNEIKRLNNKLNIIEKAVYEGYYDEIGDYILNFNKDALEKALKEVFNAKEVKILH